MGKADGLKGRICLDVVRRLCEDSVISYIDWCGYIYDCLRDSKLSSGTNHYLGPLTFLILLYLDSTKFDRFLVVRIRSAIKNWSTYLMKQRQESELKRRVLGLLDLHVEWTEAKVQDTEGFIGSLEFSEKKVCGYTAFKHEAHHVQSESHEILDPISFDVDVDAGNDGNGDDDGDDDNDNDSDGNEEEEDVNEGDKDPNG
nr:hypothetical protein [Tanacetum cinerariifolium]